MSRELKEPESMHREQPPLRKGKFSQILSQCVYTCLLNRIIFPHEYVKNPLEHSECLKLKTSNSHPQGTHKAGLPTLRAQN